MVASSSFVRRRLALASVTRPDHTCEEDRTLRAVLVVSVRRAQRYLDRLRRRLTVEGADD
jgi:hypothetical protein